MNGTCCWVAFTPKSSTSFSNLLHFHQNTASLSSTYGEISRPQNSFFPQVSVKIKEKWQRKKEDFVAARFAQATCGKQVENWRSPTTTSAATTFGLLYWLPSMHVASIYFSASAVGYLWFCVCFLVIVSIKMEGSKKCDWSRTRISELIELHRSREKLRNLIGLVIGRIAQSVTRSNKEWKCCRPGQISHI